MLNTVIQPNIPLSPVRGALLKTESYTSEVLRSLDAFLAIKADWNALIEKSGEVSLNLDHGWLYAWLKNFDTDCGFIILVRNEAQQLIGAAPFKISCPKAGLNRRMLRHIQFIGSEPCIYDEMKIITDPQENSEFILKEIAQEIIKASKKWDVIDLRYNPDESQVTQLLAYLSESTYQGKIEQTMSCPYFKLPENHEAYEKEYPKNRKKRRRHHNQLNRDFDRKPIKLEFLTQQNDIDKALDSLIQRHIGYWEGRGVRSGFERYTNMRSFYEDLLSQYPSEDGKLGQVRFSVLKLDDEILSYDIGLQQKNGYLGHLGSYAESFKRYGPGFLHTEALIENAIQNGDTHFYFGRGNENHKTNWADKEQKLFNLLIFKTRLSSLQWQGDIWLKKLLKKA